MTVVSITLPSDLLNRLDALVKSRGYSNRSEAFRDAVRNLIGEWERTQAVADRIAATLLVTCEFERKDVILKLAEIRHEYDDVVVENIHRHVRQDYCLDVFIAEGNHQRVLDLLGRIRAMRNILEIKALFMPLVTK